MGKLTYESTIKVDFNDRLLAHLQLVNGEKLRRGECFHFSWKDDVSICDGRTARSKRRKPECDEDQRGRARYPAACLHPIQSTIDYEYPPGGHSDRTEIRRFPCVLALARSLS